MRADSAGNNISLKDESRPDRSVILDKDECEQRTHDTKREPRSGVQLASLDPNVKLRKAGFDLEQRGEKKIVQRAGQLCHGWRFKVGMRAYVGLNISNDRNFESLVANSDHPLEVGIDCSGDVELRSSQTYGLLPS